MFTVTDEWLEANRTHRGGYFNAQIRALGTEPYEGWKRDASGRQITEEQKAAFELGARERPPKGQESKAARIAFRREIYDAVYQRGRK